MSASKEAALETRLPPELAFVVQFRDGATTRSAMSGRVEHFVSGRASRFESIDDLVAFVEQVLSVAQRPG